MSKIFDNEGTRSMSDDIFTTAISDPDQNGWVSIRVACALCGHTTWTGHKKSLAPQVAASIKRTHLAQHAPGRALDIVVDWEPSADCSVCENGGNITQTGDGLECGDCGTTWDINGEYGEIMEGTQNA